MTGSSSATVETLTAEVRVLMVGSRQVTLSVYNQLDWVPSSEIEPLGRVNPKDALHGWAYIVGRNNDGGALVRATVPITPRAVAGGREAYQPAVLDWFPRFAPIWTIGPGLVGLESAKALAEYAGAAAMIANRLATGAVERVLLLWAAASAYAEAAKFHQKACRGCAGSECQEMRPWMTHMLKLDRDLYEELIPASDWVELPLIVLAGLR